MCLRYRQHCLRARARALIAERRVIELILRRDSCAIVGGLLRCASNGEIEKSIPRDWKRAHTISMNNARGVFCAPPRLHAYRGACVFPRKGTKKKSIARVSGERRNGVVGGGGGERIVSYTLKLL